MSGIRRAAYWFTTLVLATECVVGGVMGALQLPPFLDTATHLGYPAYFMSILGVWYVAAGLVLLAPRLPRLKEWAYAGLVFNYTGAAASHIWVGDGAETLVAPVIFLCLTAASWALRPPARRDLPFAALRIDHVRDVIEHLGYPTYLLTIMGVWKVPGAVALLIPRFPRLKEWAYAGAVVAPVSQLALTVVSWALRPDSSS